jgi:hypothetical protein
MLGERMDHARIALFTPSDHYQLAFLRTLLSISLPRAAGAAVAWIVPMPGSKMAVKPVIEEES